MTEDAISSEPLVATPAPVAPSTAGAMMRQAREAMGLHIAALAVSLKVPVKKLEALEADRLHEMHDAVFVRALASSVCRSLRIDPLPVLDKLPQTNKPALQPEVDINAPFQAPGDAQAPTLASLLLHPLSLAVAALLVAAALVGFWPELQKWAGALGVRTAPGAAVAPAPATTLAAPTVAAVSNAPSSTASAVTLAASSALPSDATLPQVEPSASAPMTGAAVAAVSVSPAAPVVAGVGDSAAAASGLLVFTARAPTWVEVAERSGTVTFRKMLAAGESATASGNLPVSVVIGRADSVDVQVRGKPFDLAQVAKANVARFEVK